MNIKYARIFVFLIKVLGGINVWEKKVGKFNKSVKIEKFLLSNFNQSNHSDYNHILLYRMWSEPE